MKKNFLRVSWRADHTYKDISARETFIFNRHNPEMIVRCSLSSAVFRSVTARTENNALVAISQKSQKGRTQLCIKCECRTTKVLVNKQ